MFNTPFKAISQSPCLHVSCCASDKVASLHRGGGGCVPGNRERSLGCLVHSESPNDVKSCLFSFYSSSYRNHDSQDASYLFGSVLIHFQHFVPFVYYRCPLGYGRCKCPKFGCRLLNALKVSGEIHLEMIWSSCGSGRAVCVSRGA